MNATLLGLICGLALGFAGAFGGFLVVLLLGAIGLAVGRFVDEQLGLSGFGGDSRDRVGGGRVDRRSVTVLMAGR
jgi:hypothetical protein